MGRKCVADPQIEGWVGGSACIFFLRKKKNPYDLMDDPLHNSNNNTGRKVLTYCDDALI